jgi:hypothetical protein
MPRSLYLGTVQFGTEAFHAESEVLFSAENYQLSVEGSQTANGTESVVELPALKKPDMVDVPGQVPTMKRFQTRDSGDNGAEENSAGAGVMGGAGHVLGLRYLCLLSGVAAVLF